MHNRRTIINRYPKVYPGKRFLLREGTSERSLPFKTFQCGARSVTVPRKYSDPLMNHFTSDEGLQDPSRWFDGFAALLWRVTYQKDSEVDEGMIAIATYLDTDCGFTALYSFIDEGSGKRFAYSGPSRLKGLTDEAVFGFEHAYHGTDYEVVAGGLEVARYPICTETYPIDDGELSCFIVSSEVKRNVTIE